jgi:hypothetical protein
MKNKTILFGSILVAALMLASMVFADPKDYDKKADKGIYYLVSKDTDTWEVLPRETSAFGMAKFSIEDGELTMRLVAHKLAPGNWYMLELVEKDSGCGWIGPIGDTNRYSSFYGQADDEGNVKISVSWDVTGYEYIEVNLKNADNVALHEPSAYGVPSEWILGTGQGWDHVLYGAATIPEQCVWV